MTALWADETMSARDRWHDVGLVHDGVGLLRTLPGTASTEAVLATDLHAGNVLRAAREPWLVIDPKPFVGDPAYDATQHLFNCRDRLVADPSGTIARFSALLGLDAERVRLWAFARAAAEPRDNWSDPELLTLARNLRA
jgi:streptomycin 6-kinase